MKFILKYNSKLGYVYDKNGCRVIRRRIYND